VGTLPALAQHPPISQYLPTPLCGIRHTHVLYKPWWKQSQLQEKQLMVSPVAIFFLLKECTKLHLRASIFFKNFLGGACSQTPLGSAAYAPSRFTAHPPKELPSKIIWIRPAPANLNAIIKLDLYNYDPQLSFLLPSISVPASIPCSQHTMHQNSQSC